MNKLTVNHKTDDNAAIAARRHFLRQLACGSLLAVGGNSLVEAASKHAAKPVAHSSKANAAQKVHQAAHKPAPVQHTVAHHVDKHHADKHQIAPHLSHHQAAHHVVKHEAAHDVLAVHHPSQHAKPQVITPVTDYEPAPRPAPLHSISAYTHHKILALKNAHTGDALQLTYFKNGRYIEDALKEIDYLYQDHLTGEVYPVDTGLLDQLHELKQMIGTESPIHIVCGYRSPLTNAYLRRQSSSVARNSLHMQGRAIDIRIDGVSTHTIRNAALAMGRGGVGYYPNANFVHLDTGDIRTW